MELMELKASSGQAKATDVSLEVSLPLSSSAHFQSAGQVPYLVRNTVASLVRNTVPSFMVSFAGGTRYYRNRRQVPCGVNFQS